MSPTRRFSYARLLAGLLMLGAIVVVAGCARPAPPAPPKKALDVTVVEPLVHMVTKAEDFTGRTEAYKYVEIKPQVGGELKEIFFKDGDSLPKGARLFEIDQRMYIAQQKNAVAALARAKANLAQTKADLERADAALKKGVGAQADFDAAIANRDAAIANVEAAKASLDMADLNLIWTRIDAPFSGRLGMRLVDPHNMVTAYTTTLTTLIQLDPIYIGFDIDEQTVERRREAIQAGEIPSARDAKLEVEVGFGHQEGYPYRALVTFADNQFNAGTGTLHIRAEMHNPTVRAGFAAVVGSAAAQEVELKELRLLSPNMYARVRVPLGRPYQALLVPEEAIGSDQGHKFVYVVNEKNAVEYRRIKPGPMYHPEDPADMRVFRAINERKPNSPRGEGISRGERVVLGGQQRIKEGDAVNPKLVVQKYLDGK